MASNVVEAVRGETGWAVDAAAEVLERGDLVVLPTDTVYGVAVDAFSPPSTEKVFRARGSSRAYPLPVLVSGPQEAEELVQTLPEAAHRLMAAHWPGPLTLVVCSARRHSWELGDTEGTVALRMPLEDVALRLIRSVGPLAVTSASRAGGPPARTVEQARDALGDAVQLYVDGGPRTRAAPSTIVDLTRADVHVLREGAVPVEQVLAVAHGREVDELGADPTATEEDLVRNRLSDVPGVGPTRLEALMERYGSTESIRGASVDDIAANVSGFGEELARRVKEAIA